MTEPRFKSDAFEAIHSAASDLHHAGVVSKQTMREFDEMCLAEAFRSEAKNHHECSRTIHSLF